MTTVPHLTRYVSQNVALLGDIRRPGGVTLAFTERTGGYSRPPYASLNLGDACGDDAETVAANRRRLLSAIGAPQLVDRLVNPEQVHGTDVLLVTSNDPDAVSAAQESAREGVDAIVCTVSDVPVLLCSADCVSLVLVGPGCFAVVHSGWRGTIDRIAGKALEALCSAGGCTASEVMAYIGPHIGPEDYEVSSDLADRFAQAFGDEVVPGGDHLDLGLAIRMTLREGGVADQAISDECPSTASCTNRFFSFRAEGGTCGRMGALAVILGEQAEEVISDGV